MDTCSGSRWEAPHDFLPGVVAGSTSDQQKNSGGGVSLLGAFTYVNTTFAPGLNATRGG